MTTCSSTYGSTVISDTGLPYVPNGIDLTTTWRPLPNGHSNGTMRMTDEPPAGPGHTSGGRSIDPGPATDLYEVKGPLAIRKDKLPAEEMKAFTEAIRSQGNADVRQAAITNMLARVRANPAIKHHDYRLLEQIASCTRWEYRYCCQSNKALAYFAAQADPKNIGRSLSNLLGAGVVAGIDVPRQIGGWPVTYYTLRCTAEDRSTQTIGNLNAGFKALVSSRHPDDLLPSSRPPDDTNPSQVVPQTTCKSSGGGVASRPTDAQTVNKRNMNTGHHGADAPSAGATEDLFPERAPPQGGTSPEGASTSAKDTPCKPSSAEPKGKRAALKPKATEEQFDRFWAAYPIRDGKAAAQRNFTKLTHAEAELAVYGAAQYAAKVAGEREKLARRGEEPKVKWAQGWLSERRFEDYEDAYGSASTNDVEAALRRHAASADGQRVLARYGQEEGMRRLREIITDSTKGAS
jgi:hypothetical protein